MDNKPVNILDKLDDQSEKLDNISEKLGDINIKDLYALAKRTWEVKDYINAQKYFNHLSLLNPLDWEAPLYAALCTSHGMFNLDEAHSMLEKQTKVISTTFEYISNLTLEPNIKENEFYKCAQIVDSELTGWIKSCRSNIDFYCQEGKVLIKDIENMMVDILAVTSKINAQQMRQFSKNVAERLIDFVNETFAISRNINDGLLSEIYQITDHRIDEKVIEAIKIEQNEDIDTKGLPAKEIATIKLKGKWYFEYDDAFEAKRFFRKRLITGLIIASTSLICLIVSASLNGSLTFVAISNFICSLPMVWWAFSERKHIRANSFFSTVRVKRWLRSNHMVSITLCRIPIAIILYDVLVIVNLTLNIVGAILWLMANNQMLFVDYVGIPILLVDSILAFVMVYKLSPTSGYFRCCYKEKSYQFDV